MDLARGTASQTVDLRLGALLLQARLRKAHRTFFSQGAALRAHFTCVFDEKKGQN